MKPRRHCAPRRRRSLATCSKAISIPSFRRHSRNIRWSVTRPSTLSPKTFSTTCAAKPCSPSAIQPGIGRKNFSAETASWPWQAPPCFWRWRPASERRCGRQASPASKPRSRSMKPRRQKRYRISCSTSSEPTRTSSKIPSRRVRPLPETCSTSGRSASPRISRTRPRHRTQCWTRWPTCTTSWNWTTKRPSCVCSEWQLSSGPTGRAIPGWRMRCSLTRQISVKHPRGQKCCPS